MTLTQDLPRAHAPRPRSARVIASPRRSPRSTRRERCVVALGLVLVAVVYSINLAGWPRYFDDEGTYSSQAWAVQHLGALSPYTYWYDHPPVGWLQLAAFTWLPDLLIHGNSAILSGRIVMVGYALVSAGLLYMLARRLGLTRFWSLAAMLLWALDPLVVYEGRQVFLDGVALPWLLGAFVLALNHRRHLGLHMAAGLCFAVAVLSKETTAVFVVPLLLAIWQSAYRPIRRFALMGFSAVLVMTGAMYLLFALIRNELFPGPDHVSLWNALTFQFLDRAGSGSIFDPHGPDGGSYETFHSWLQLDSFLLLGGVAAGLVALLVRRLRLVGVAVLLVALVGLRPSGYLPQMYVVGLLPFCALALVGVLDALWRRASGFRGRALSYAAGVVVLSCLAVVAVSHEGWPATYTRAWTQDANDPQSAVLREVRGLPGDARIAVDNTSWSDLVDQGRSRDDVVWFFKVDNDASVLEQLGGSYLGLDYLVWTTYMAENAGPEIGEAFSHSVLVSGAGIGDDRVELRRVLDVDEYAAQERAKADAVTHRLAAEKAALDLFFTQPSRAFPDLTNGQIEGIRLEAPALGRAALARKYQTTEATINAVLRQIRARDRLDAMDRGR